MNIEMKGPAGSLSWFMTKGTDKKIFILIIKANEMHIFSNSIDTVLYMSRTGSLSIIRSISTLYTRSKYLSC